MCERHCSWRCSRLPWSFQAKLTFPVVKEPVALSELTQKQGCRPASGGVSAFPEWFASVWETSLIPGQDRNARCTLSIQGYVRNADSSHTAGFPSAMEVEGNIIKCQILSSIWQNPPWGSAALGIVRWSRDVLMRYPFSGFDVGHVELSDMVSGERERIRAGIMEINQLWNVLSKQVQSIVTYCIKGVPIPCL